MDIMHAHYASDFGYERRHLFSVKADGAQFEKYPEGLFDDAAPSNDDHDPDQSAGERVGDSPSRELYDNAGEYDTGG
jgi:hypothetical protein